MMPMLKRQFPRSELYVFELLQNAVDEGAFRVQFRLDPNHGNLIVQHNGQSFSAVDIVGLSSVGLSGKSGRTLGFIGLGFKAVYKRFGTVRVSGSVWRFRFEEPDDRQRLDCQVLPMWDDEGTPPDQPYRCRFEFQRPRGGEEQVRKDLGYLTPEIP